MNVNNERMEIVDYKMNKKGGSRRRRRGRRRRI